MPTLDDPRALELPPKIARLAQLRQAGLPVPPGVALRADGAPAPAESDALAGLVADGPVLVRSALHLEDRAGHSGAGLGESVPECRDLADVRAACKRVASSHASPEAARYRELLGVAAAPPHALVQRQVPRERLLVLAVLPGAPAPAIYLEVHEASGDALATGRSPDFSGPLPQWAHPAAAAVRSLAMDTARVLGDREPLDLEVILDPAGVAHLVQARPLARDLARGGADFVAEVRRRGQGHLLEGVWTLDAEHNPAPLSPAHASLLDWLRRERPGLGDPTALAGWLYVRTLPRDLARPPTPPPDAAEVLAALRDRWLPEAARSLLELSDGLRAARAPEVVAGLGRARAAFLAMIDRYAGTLIPARRAAARAGLAADPERPSTLLDRERFAAVLPVTWDVASASLDPTGTPPLEPSAAPLPKDPAALAALLGEWDDHLFALGLAHVRAAYLAAARALALPHPDVFLLPMPALERALATGRVDPDLLARGRASLARAAALHPPARLLGPHPLPPTAGGLLRGIPIGPPHEGPVDPRPELGALLDGPPPAPGAVVVTCALTAQAAIVLQRLGVRAVCCEHGGALSHAALMARELGLSALVGCRGCTRLPAGTRVRVDTRAGRLLPLPDSA